MDQPSRKSKRRLVAWKQFPTLALAGCTLAGSADSPALLASCPTRASHAWDPRAHGLRASCWPVASIEPIQFLFQRDSVLGTSFDLVVWATQSQDAFRVEGIVLAEIARLGRILSRHDSQSDLSRLNASPFLAEASPDLIAVLRAYELWTARTGGALSGQLGGLVHLWKSAEATGITPSGADLAAQLERLREPGWEIDAQARRVHRLGAQSLNLDCIGKGYILQQAVEAARVAFPGIWGIMLNIGGDISVWGNAAAQAGTPWQIFFTDPRRPHDNAPPLTSIRLSRGAVATSAAYERGFTIAGRRHSHILDSRTGQPAQGVASATVVARESSTANALATALCVLTPGEGLDLLSSIEGVEGLIIAANGSVFRTPGFAVLELPLAQVSPPPASATNAPATTETPAAETPAAPATVAPQAPPAPAAETISPGQIVTVTTSDPVSFAKGTSKVKRPVQPDEKFQVTSVMGDDITLADQFGLQTTLNRSIVKLVNLPPPPTPTPTPAAVAQTPTNAAPVPATNPSPTPSGPAAASSWPAGFQVTLGIELPQPPPNLKGIKRPFVAIWIEDSAGKPIRTVAVWGNEPKYIPNLTNWWQFAKGQPKVVANTTRATRAPGKYPVTWDGLDDAGQPVPQGSYNVVLEVRREHAGHDIHRTTIQCGTASAQGLIPGAVEFLDCPVTYGPPGP